MANPSHLRQHTSSMLTRIDRRSLKGEAVDQIRSAILQGELKPGQRVTELGLAKGLGVGQATIREALIELEHQGFIQRGSPRKTFVTDLSQREINDMYMVRIRLESLVVELLVNQKRGDLGDCETAYRKLMESAKRGDFLEFCQVDLDFHRSLWRAAGNQSLLELLERLVPRLFAFVIIQRTNPSRQSLVESVKQHGRLLQLIREGKHKEAQAALEESMQQALSDDLQTSGKAGRHTSQS
jgi:DNA-binding GntR family transcriptional regulator